MASLFKNLLLLALPLAGVAAAPTPASYGSSNHVIGSWIEVNTTINFANGTKVNQFPDGTPASLLVFTPDLQYSADFSYPNGMALPIGDFLNGTANPAAEHGSLMFFGTYTVGSDGNLDTQHVIASTVQQVVGTTRTRAIYNVTRVDENTLREDLSLGGGDIVTAFYRPPVLGKQWS